MSCTKKDFEAIAEAFQDARRSLAPGFGHGEHSQEYIDAIEECASCVAHALWRSNHRFDRDRFLRACEPGANVRAR